MDKYGNNLVNMIETKPLSVFLSYLTHMLPIVRGCTLLILKVKGHWQMWGCAGMLRFALPLFVLFIKVHFHYNILIYHPILFVLVLKCLFLHKVSRNITFNKNFISLDFTTVFRVLLSWRLTLA